MTTWRRCALVGLLLGLLLGSASAVVAASVHSSYKFYGPHSGYEYKNRSSLYDNPNAYSSVDVTNGGNAPAGWYGIKPRLFTANGTLCQAADWWYSPNPSAGASVNTYPTQLCGSGNYYSHGKTSAWLKASSTYTEYLTYQTPNMYLS